MHLTPYELWEKYGKFGASSSMRDLLTRWNRKGVLVSKEVPISETNLHVKRVFCEHEFCRMVELHRTETYVGKIFCNNLPKIRKTLATNCDNAVYCRSTV